ncbi:MAG: hypothetical protein J6X65_09690 [Bacteroidales bacterium]|nr:hypothetical protein [Bacteroidales bacterium]
MNSILDYFKYTPYDNKISQCVVPSNMTAEDFFWNKLYVNFPTENRERIINDLTEAVFSPNIHKILFMGSSGAGKTTFLHQVDFDRKIKNGGKCVADFFNLINKPSSTINNDILTNNVDDKIADVLDRNTINKIQSLIDEYVEQKAGGKYQWDTIFMHSSTYDYHKEFDNFIGSTADAYSRQSVIQFCNEINNVTEKIALYLIAFVLKEALPEQKKCVFIFDNLDEISQESLLSFLNNDINTAFSKAQDFFDKYCPKYNFLNNCTIITSVRNTFTAYNNAGQLIDRQNATSKTIVFKHVSRASISEMIENRTTQYLSQSEITDKERSRVNNILEIIKNDNRFFSDLGQLCNYDCRKVLNAIGEVFQYQSDFQSNKTLKDPRIKAGARGFILFRIFHSRINDASSRFRAYAEADINQNGCNIFRMLFTLLSNMSGAPSDTNNSETVDYQKNRVSLLEFTQRIQDWHKKAAVKSIYNTLFVSGNISHAIPATLSGEAVNKYISDRQYNASLSSLCEHISDLYKNDKNMLNDIYVTVNPLCIAYAERVFIHFEYFNVMSLMDLRMDSKLKEPEQSLFQMNKKDEIENCVNRVFHKTSEIIKKADTYFCSLCSEEKNCAKGENNWREDCMKAINKFADDAFLIKRTLYVSRLITSHIRYLDVFRQFYALRSLNDGENFDINMNVKIIEYIERYVTLYESKAVRDNTIKEVMARIKDNIPIAKKASEFVPIATEDDSI